jgi:quinol monooxygenase YgiN
MPVVVKIAPKNMSKDDYEKVMKELEDSGCGSPEGRLSHASSGDDELQMHETWESREQFDAYHNKLMDVLDGAGIDGGTVEVSQLRGGSV